MGKGPELVEMLVISNCQRGHWAGHSDGSQGCVMQSPIGETDGGGVTCTQEDRASRHRLTPQGAVGSALSSTPANPCVPQTMVMEQAARGSSPPDLRVQYLRQIHANHEVSVPLWAPSQPGLAWPSGEWLGSGQGHSG